MRHRPLAPAALAILHHLATHRHATTRELITVQQALNDGRTEASRQAQPYNLMRLGYIEQATVTRPAKWAITARGRTALDNEAPQGASSSASLQPTRTRRTTATTFTYGGRQVAAPTGPRWAFDLATDITS